MAALLLVSTSRTTFTDVVRRALRDRGYVENDARGEAIYVSIWAHVDSVGCNVDSSWLFEGVLRGLADDAIEARAVTVTIERISRTGRGVGEADVVQVSGGEIEKRDAQDEADEILQDWTDGDDAFDQHLMETSLAYALLDVDEPEGNPPERELLRFQLDPVVAADAAARARARAEARVEAEARAKALRERPAEWQRFRHPDGRRWAVRVRNDGFDLEMTDADGDTFTRSRPHENARAEVALLVVAQLREGFVDEPR